MNVFITGLCLQGNKGGPAIALSLTQQLEERFGPTTFTLSVPAAEFAREQQSAADYGLEVVADFGLRDLLPPFVFRRLPGGPRKVRQWLAAARRADVIVEMSAICYTGPPVGTARAALLTRFRYFVLARLLRRPFMAWTQSYGPFSSRSIRLLARLDLKRQQVIFCRGTDCEDAVQALLPDAATESFPDVAVVLDFDDAWGKDYLAGHWPGLDLSELITLSPSAVLYGRAAGSESSNAHVQEMADIVRYLLGRGRPVLLVPHTLRPERHVPELCDGAVAELIEAAVADPRCAVVTDDLSPMELKSLISNARVHIGGRYHSVVAALSAGVPCLSLSWHPKYRDIMRVYGVDEYVVPEEEEGAWLPLLDRLMSNRDNIAAELRQAHPAASAAVERNADMFVALVDS